MKIERAQVPTPAPVAEDRSTPVWEAAQGLEAHFIKEMMRNMRKTVQESPELANNRGYQIFRGMQDDHFAETAAKSQGIGLAEIIVKQMMELQEAARQKQAPSVRELNKSDVIGK